MKRNLSTVGPGDVGKSLLTASGKIVHKIKKVDVGSLVFVVTYCGKAEYVRSNQNLSAPLGTWYSTAHGWYAPITCRGCIDNERAASVEDEHKVRIHNRRLGRSWGSSRTSYGRTVTCSCGWERYTNESQEGSAKLNRWAEARRLEHLLERADAKERDEALHEALQEDAEVLAAEEQPLDEVLRVIADGDGPYAVAAQETIERHEDTPRFSDGSPAPIDLMSPTEEEPYDERAARRKADEEFYRHVQEQDGCDHLTVVPFELLRVASGHQMKVVTQSGVELWLRLPTLEEFKTSVLESGAKLVADGLPADCLPPVPPDEEIERIIRPLNL